MDGISWSDLDPDEQRTIAMLGPEFPPNYGTPSLS